MNSTHTCLAVISFDSALKKNENYHPQVFLKQYKYIKNKYSLYGYYSGHKKLF